MLGRAVFLLFLSLAACSSSPEPPLQKIQGFAQGTTYHISFWSEEPVDAQAIESDVQAEFDSLDKTLSNYRPDSVIERFNANASVKSQEVGPEIVHLVNIARQVYQLSHGCFDLTIKPLFDMWGFTGDTLTIPAPEAIQAGLARVGMDKLEVVDDTHLLKKQEDVRVDLSAEAQGYSVGKISEVLEAHDVHNYMVEIGGELKTNGHRPNGQGWRIAVEKPLAGERSVHKIVTMPKDAPMSVMTSGTYRHYFDSNGVRYSHILDARTGRPVSHNLVAVTVFHEDPAIADAWSTTLLCLGQAEGLQVANAEKLNAIFIRQQDSELLETQSDALRVSNNLMIQ